MSINSFINTPTSTTMPSSEVTTTETASHFENLPVEIKLEILSLLPAKEILRCRSVGKHVRELISAPDNATALFSLAEARSQARIQDFWGAHCTPSVSSKAHGSLGKAFLAALQDFAAHYGMTTTPMAESSTGYYERLTLFALQWEGIFKHEHQSGEWPLSVEDALSSTSCAIKGAAFYILELHRKPSRERVVRRVAPTWPACVGFADNEEVEMLMESIKPGGKRLVNTPIMHSETAFEELIRADRGFPLDTRVRRGGYEDSQKIVARLAEKFGVPNVAMASTFEYRTRSVWAMLQIKDAMAGRTLSRGIRAAAMEDLYIAWK
jgi:hypothetical protein